MGDSDVAKFTSASARDSLMLFKVFADRTSLSQAAADHAANTIRRAISQQGHARVVVASAASQIEFLEAFTRAKGIDWPKVEVFHLDEYIGLAISHPGSFRKMIVEQLINKTGITNYHLIDGDAADPAAVARQLGEEIASAPIDIAFLGIGENGHIAFNDPPANFETEEPYIVVNLDEACRQQQVGEAWFANLSQVPKQAISMSVRQILKARELIAIVPDKRKARAVKASFESEISPQVPASILRSHFNVTVFLDKNSASLLSPEMQSLGTHELPVAISR